MQSDSSADEDQGQHCDRGFGDSLSILIYIENGAIVINGVKEARKGNSAVIFSTSVPHAGAAHMEGSIRIFLYIDFVVVDGIKVDEFPECACIDPCRIRRRNCGTIASASRDAIFCHRE